MLYTCLFFEYFLSSSSKMSSVACHVSWFCNRFSTNSTVHLTERNFQSYRKNFKHALESQRLANPIRPHPHAATTQKTAEPVPPCTAARDRLRRFRPPHKIIQKEYKKIHFFFDRIFYYKGTSFMNETKRCISKSKNHIQTDKT